MSHISQDLDADDQHTDLGMVFAVRNALLPSLILWALLLAVLWRVL